MTIKVFDSFLTILFNTIKTYAFIIIQGVTLNPVKRFKCKSKYSSTNEMPYF